MHSTLKPKQADDPHDVLVVASDAVPVASADAVPVASANEQLARLVHDAVRQPLDPQTLTGSGFATAPPVRPVDTTFRPSDVNDIQILGRRRWIDRPAVRVLTALLLAAGVAAIAWQSYGDAAKQMIVTWAPQSALTSWLPLEKLGLPAQPTPPAVAPGAAEAAASPAAAPAQTAPAAAALSPESAQLIQSMAHDLATVGQQIEQLKASIEQLKAGQQQMSRDVAKASEKASEQNLRPRITPPVPRPAVARVRKPPMPPYPLPPAAAAATVPQASAPQASAPYVPRQPQPLPDATAEPQLDPELRPPMPVR
jgi:hypothetical protein